MDKQLLLSDMVKNIKEKPMFYEGHITSVIVMFAITKPSLDEIYDFYAIFVAVIRDINEDYLVYLSRTYIQTFNRDAEFCRLIRGMTK